MDKRSKYLESTARSLIDAAGRGVLVKKKGIPVQAQIVNGPRAGAVNLHCGIHAKSILKALDSATVRQFISWPFTGNPIAYMPADSRAVRIEAGWPPDLAERDIKLNDIGTRPRKPGAWITGKNETGTTIVVGLDDSKPGYLIGGETGSGKTFSFRSTIAQLSGVAWGKPNNTRLVLIDGKFGEGLNPVSRLPGVVGPLALDEDNANAALRWAHSQMVYRYENGFPELSQDEKEAQGRIIVAIDEVQTFSKNDEFTETLRNLVNQGRAAWVHILVGTQHPTVDILNDSALKAGLVGRIGLRTTSYKASEVIFGGPQPRADYLQDGGDSYVLVPSSIQRVQWAYIPNDKLAAMNCSEPAMSSWPDYDSTQDPGRFSGEELAVALLHAWHNGGRETLKNNLSKVLDINPPGSPRAGAMLEIARTQAKMIKRLGFKIVRG